MPGGNVRLVRGWNQIAKNEARKGKTWSYLLLEVGLRYNEKANAPGAQTDRPGQAPAGESCAWRLILTGLLA